MKKAKALTKRKVGEFVRSSEELERPIAEPLDDELVEEVVSAEITTDDFEFEEPKAAMEDAVETVEEPVFIDEPVLDEKRDEAESTVELEPIPEPTEKKNFWGKFKQHVIEEKISVEHETVEVEKEERKSSMSYSAKQSSYSSDASAVVSSTMVIRGDVDLETSLVFAGKIVGNVTCKDTVESKTGGSIEGNLTSLSADFVGGSVKGNVSCEERIVVDEASVIEGDLSAKDIVISGKVVGEVKASGSVKLTHSANIKGDLHAATVSIEAGARLDGKFVVTAAE